MIIPLRVCNGPLCEGAEIPVDQFSVKNPKTGYISPKCDDCVKECNRIRAKNDYQKRLARNFVYPDHQICPDCNNDLPIESFNFKSQKNGEREIRCGKCAYNARDKEKRKKRFKIWYYKKGGKEKCQMAWEKYKPVRNSDIKKRRKTDKSFAIEQNVRSRIYQILRKNKTKRIGKVKYLGIDIETYIEWLEYQFTDGMTWKNYGEYWHIDHVRPCDSFTFTSYDDDAIYECFNWKNTRPMIGEDNLSKGNKIDHVEIAKHKIVVWMFKLDYGLDADD